jgi:hypothetical protein
VSAETPTDVEAVNDLAEQAPGRVWMHKAGKLPYEIKVGSALMHSKVFYSEAGPKAWLWVGSHNLTARATEGANLEAAMLLTGDPSESPFVQARQHIEACRDESSLCPFNVPVLPDGEPVDVVVVHAETEELPDRTVPWHVRLGLRSAEYDWMLSPVADARLHLYRPGNLIRGWQKATPWVSYHGTLTGLNLTEIHPDSPGIPASWSDEHYSIIEERQILLFSKRASDTAHVVTQAVINIDGPAPSSEAFLSTRPKAVAEENRDDRLLEPIDPDMSRFFSKPSVRSGKLFYELRRRGGTKWNLPVGDLREQDRDALQGKADERSIEMVEAEDNQGRIRHPLIMRAKYQLRVDR